MAEKEVKALVVYYSRSGNTKKVGDCIASEFKCDIEEIVDMESRSGALGWIRSGGEGFLKKTVKIKPAQKNPAQYDMVVIGTPVWFMTVTSPVRSYIVENKDKLKKVAFFCTRNNTGEEQMFKEMESICGKKPEGTLVVTAGELAQGNIVDKVKRFSGEIKREDPL
jgi:flavodoxin